MDTPSGTLTLVGHKHHLIVLANDESFMDAPEIHDIIAFFKCRLCDRHFYILKSDLYAHLAGTNTKPFKPNRGMFMRDQDGKWQLIYTVVS